MTKSRKYFLSFIVYALSTMLICWSEYLFCDNLTPFKLILPVVFILLTYSIFLYQVSKGKTHDSQ